MRTPFACLVLSLCLAVAAPAKTDPATEKELMAAMDGLKQAMLTKDVALMTRITHPDLTYTHSSGLNQDKQTVLAALPAITTGSIEYLKNNIRVFGNTALIKNTTDIRPAAALGTPFLLDVLYIWVKGSDGWQLVARQPIRLADPNAKGPGAAKKN